MTCHDVGSLEEDVWPHVGGADHVTEQGLAKQSHRAEDVGWQPIEWENISQPAENKGTLI